MNTGVVDYCITISMTANLWMTTKYFGNDAEQSWKNHSESRSFWSLPIYVRTVLLFAVLNVLIFSFNFFLWELPWFESITVPVGKCSKETYHFVLVLHFPRSNGPLLKNASKKCEYEIRYWKSLCLVSETR